MFPLDMSCHLIQSTSNPFTNPPHVPFQRHHPTILRPFDLDLHQVSRVRADSFAVRMCRTRRDMIIHPVPREGLAQNNLGKRIMWTCKGDLNSNPFFCYGEPAASETSCLLRNTINPTHGRGEDKACFIRDTDHNSRKVNPPSEPEMPLRRHAARQ